MYNNRPYSVYYIKRKLLRRFEIQEKKQNANTVDSRFTSEPLSREMFLAERRV